MINFTARQTQADNSNLQKNKTISTLTTSVINASLSGIKEGVCSSILYDNYFDHSNDLCIQFNYQKIYEAISEFYFPLLNNINNSPENKININSLLNRLVSCIQNKKSLFAFNCKEENSEHLLKTAKEYENILLSLFVFYFQLKMKLNFTLSSVTIHLSSFFTNLKFCFNVLYKVCLLSLFAYDDVNSEKKHIISFKELCTKYVDNYFLTSPYYNKSNDYIIEHIPYELDSIKQTLLIVAFDLISNYYNSTFSFGSKLINEKSITQISLFEKIFTYLNNYNGMLFHSCEDIPQEMLNIFTYLQSHTKVKEPFLPKLNSLQYSYTLIFDLDETLVHCSINDNNAIKIRPYAKELLLNLSKYFEIVLFTASVEEYAEIVIKNFEGIHYKLYRKHTTKAVNKYGKEFYIKDLSKIGRSLLKVCLIDNNKDSFLLQPENGLEISSYYGDGNDKELYFLQNDLMEIYHKDENDIRKVLVDIRTNMKRRYEQLSN